MKVFGQGANRVALHRERIELEVRVLRHWAHKLGAEASRFLPALYLFDEQSMVFVMEFLEDFLLLDAVLESEPVSDGVWDSLGTFMALTHARSHSTKVSSEECAELATEYANPVLRDIQTAFVFTKCFEESTNPSGQDNAQVRLLTADPDRSLRTLRGVL